MITIISPAKSLDFESVYSYTPSEVRFPNETQELIKFMQTKSSDELKELMKISDKIADLNVERFFNFSDQYKKDKNAKHALFAFTGDVYQGMNPQSMNESDVNYAQEHLRILSGLYGLLRPLDLIQAYRLEMGTKLNFEHYKNLYDFWGNKITNLLNQDLAEKNTTTLLNLASNEYFKSIKKKELNADIINVDFKDCKSGQYKTISFYAKKARGFMSRYVIENKIKSIDDLKSFNSGGYYYSKENSTNRNLIFYRDEQV